MLKLLWLCIISCWIINYSYACSWVLISDEELRINHELIVTATVHNIEQVTMQPNKDNIPSFGEPDIFYNFHIEKTFKGDQDIKTFTIAEASLSSCSTSYMSWSTYLLYLNKSTHKNNLYHPYTPATQVQNYGENIQPEFNPLRENKRYKEYNIIKTTLFRVQRNTQTFFVNTWYKIKYQFNFYKYKYGFY